MIICHDDYKFEKNYILCAPNTIINILKANAEFLLGIAEDRNCDEISDMKLDITNKIRGYCKNNFEICDINKDFIETDKLFTDDIYGRILPPTYYPNALKISIEYDCQSKQIFF